MTERGIRHEREPGLRVVKSETHRVHGRCPGGTDSWRLDRGVDPWERI